MPQEFKPDLIPGGNPQDPNYRKPPGAVSVSLGEIESIGKKTETIEPGIESLDEQLEKLSKEQTP